MRTIFCVSAKGFVLLYDKIYVLAEKSKSWGSVHPNPYLGYARNDASAFVAIFLLFTIKSVRKSSKQARII